MARWGGTPRCARGYPRTAGLARSSHGMIVAGRPAHERRRSRGKMPEEAPKTSMTDKPRHRSGLVPKGQVPNWVLVLGIAGAIALIGVIRIIA